MPGDAYIQVPPDSSGKKVDTSDLIIAGSSVERQRIVLADPTTATGLAKVDRGGAQSSVVVERPSGRATKGSIIFVENCLAPVLGMWNDANGAAYRDCEIMFNGLPTARLTPQGSSNNVADPGTSPNTNGVVFKRRVINPTLAGRYGWEGWLRWSSNGSASANASASIYNRDGPNYRAARFFPDTSLSNSTGWALGTLGVAITNGNPVSQITLQAGSAFAAEKGCTVVINADTTTGHVFMLSSAVNAGDTVLNVVTQNAAASYSIAQTVNVSWAIRPRYLDADGTYHDLGGLVNFFSATHTYDLPNLGYDQTGMWAYWRLIADFDLGTYISLQFNEEVYDLSAKALYVTGVAPSSAKAMHFSVEFNQKSAPSNGPAGNPNYRYINVASMVGTQEN